MKLITLVFYIVAIILSTVASFDVLETKLQPEGRISRGKNAADGQFPYMVGIDRLVDPVKEIYRFCGGSLLGNEWILTAAHCLENTKDAFVYLGGTDIETAEVMHIVSPKNFILHRDYNTDSLDNDIGLIKIPFTKFTKKIQPVRLPSFNSIKNTYSGELAEMSGWGGINDNNDGPDQLQWATFKVIENSVCATTYGSKIIASHICIATEAGISACDGDSGGPLVLKSINTQIGLLSFIHGSGCQKGKPIVYTRITSYLSWIKDKTGISY